MRLPILAAAIAVLLGLAGLAGLMMVKEAIYIAFVSGMGLAAFAMLVKRDLVRMHGAPVAAVGLGLPIVAWLLPNIWVLFAAMIALVPLAARRPEQITGLYLFSLMLLPGLDITVQFGTLKLCEFGVHDGITLGAALAVRHRGRARNAPLALADIPVLLVVLLLVTATARDTSATNFLRVLLNGMLDFALPYYIVTRGIRTIDDMRLALLGLGAAAAILSMVLVYECRASWPLYNILYQHYGVPTMLLVKSRGGLMRAAGPFIESTSMAMALVFCLFATLMSRPAFRDGARHKAAIALQLIGMIPPQSRGAWIGLAFGVLLADVFRARYGTLMRRALALGLVTTVLLGVAQFSQFVAENVGQSGGSTDSADYRKQLLTRGMEEFWHSPVTGFSYPELLERLSDMRQGEGIIDFVNTYLYVMLASGAIGLAIFLFAFCFYLQRSWSGRWVMRRVGGVDMAAFAFIGVATPMEMLFFTSFGGRAAMFVFICFGFSACISRQTQAIAAPRRPPLTTAAVTA